MRKHRTTFMSVWLAFTLALFLFPGFEMRGLATGMIIGHWPALISTQIYQSQYHHPFILLAMMIILSGATVFLIAWLLDKARMTSKIWILLGVSIVIGSTYLAVNVLSYKQWKSTPIVSAAMESPEVQYLPTYNDYYKEIVIPLTLAGGLWGMYGIMAVLALCSIAILLKRKLGSTTPPTVNETAT
jgi:hypothetical protein